MRIIAILVTVFALSTTIVACGGSGTSDIPSGDTEAADPASEDTTSMLSETFAKNTWCLIESKGTDQTLKILEPRLGKMLSFSEYKYNGGSRGDKLIDETRFYKFANKNLVLLTFFEEEIEQYTISEMNTVNGNRTLVGKTKSGEKADLFTCNKSGQAIAAKDLDPTDGNRPGQAKGPLDGAWYTECQRTGEWSSNFTSVHLEADSSQIIEYFNASPICFGVDKEDQIFENRPFSRSQLLAFDKTTGKGKIELIQKKSVTNPDRKKGDDLFLDQEDVLLYEVTLKGETLELVPLSIIERLDGVVKSEKTPSSRMKKLKLNRTNPAPENENRAALPAGSIFEKLFGSSKCTNEKAKLYTAFISHSSVQNCDFCLLSESYSILSKDDSGSFGIINYNRRTMPRRIGVSTSGGTQWQWVNSLGTRLSTRAQWNFKNGTVWTKYGKITSEGNELILTVPGQRGNDSISAPLKLVDVTDEDALDFSGCPAQP